MRGFKSHDAADRFRREHGELRDLLAPGPYSQAMESLYDASWKNEMSLGPFLTNSV